MVSFNCRGAAVWTALIPCLLLGNAWGAPRIMAASSGNCDDADLRSASRFFTDSLRDRLRGQVLDGDAASRQLKPRSTKSREEVQRQLASAQTQFYNLQYSKANQQVEDAVREIEAMVPGPDRWSLFLSAELLRGVIKLGAKQTREAEEAFRRILALDSNYKLDPDYYSPSTRTAFEKVRKQTASETKVAFQVRSSPSGADVFLDGYNVGKTPLNARLWPSRYQMVLVKNNQSSFPRVINIGSTGSAHVDMEFEGAVLPGQPVCISEQNTRGKDRAANAVKLGAMLGLEQIILVRIQRQSPGAQWLTASLINVQGGNEIREGGLKMDVAGAASQVSDLVAYIATGEASPEVVAVDPAKSTVAPWGPTTLSPGTPLAAASPPTTVTARRDGSGASGFFGPSLREKAWIPAAAGGALLVGGVVFHFMAKGKESQLLDKSPAVTNPQSTASSGKSLETISVITGVVGVLGLASAGAIYLFVPSAPSTPKVSVSPTQNGAMTTLSGTFP